MDTTAHPTAPMGSIREKFIKHVNTGFYWNGTAFSKHKSEGMNLIDCSYVYIERELQKIMKLGYEPRHLEIAEIQR